MKIQYMSDLHFEFRENSRYIKHNEIYSYWPETFSI